MNLFVTGLLPDMDDTDLREMFELYGEIKSARVVMDRNTGKSRRFGFVEMPNDEEAKETINLLNGAQMGRYKMSVQEAEQQAQGGGGGQRSGGYGGGAPRRDNNFGDRGPRRDYNGGGGYGGDRPRRDGGSSYGNRNNDRGGGYGDRPRRDDNNDRGPRDGGSGYGGGRRY